MISVIILIGLIKMNGNCDRPGLIAFAHTGISTLFSAMFGSPFLALVIGAALNFPLMWLFFWLLKRYEDTGMYWAIIALFIALNLGLSFAI